jgi:PadR family transcriptional regulator PadR
VDAPAPAADAAAPIVYRWGLTFGAWNAIVPSSIDGTIHLARQPTPSELLPGTLDLLILRVLREDTLHGYAIAQRLREISKDVLQVGESSLYPALQRLLLDGHVRAEWGASENNRRARFYTLTAGGRKQLVAEQEEFERMVGAIQAVLRFA